MSYKTVSIIGLIVVLGVCGCSHQSQSSANAEPDMSKVPLVKATPLSANTHFAAGQLAEVNGQLQAAILQYNIALSMEPKHAQALYRLAVIYSSLAQYDNAIETWHRYLKITDGAAEAWSNLGYCYELDSRPADAALAYEAGIKKDPNNRACRTNYGLLLARQGQMAKAVQTWRPVLSQAEIHYNLASVYEQTGHKRDARLEFEKALELDPKYADAKDRITQLDEK